MEVGMGEREGNAKNRIGTIERPEVFCDNLKDRYCSIADDSKEGAKKREGAMLFSVAEEKLETGDDPELVLQACQEALDLFRVIGDAKGTADTLRLLIHAHRMKSDLARAQGTGSEIEEPLQHAESVAKEELQIFKDAGDRRGEACMLLSLAEVSHTARGSTKRDDAFDFAVDAREIFSEVADPKMEARAVLVAAEVLIRQHKVKKAHESADEALKLFKAIGDKKGEADAWFLLGVADVYGADFGRGLSSAKKGVKLLAQIGDRKLQALTLLAMSQWLYDREDPTGLTYAKEALQIFVELGSVKGGELTAIFFVTEGYILDRETKKAVEVAAEALAKFRALDDKKEEVRALHNLAYAQLAADDAGSALKTAEEALDACRDLPCKRWEAIILETVSVIHSRDDLSQAKATAQESVGIFSQLDNPEDEGIARIQTLARVLLLKDDKAAIKDAVEECKKARVCCQTAEERLTEAWSLMCLGAAHVMADESDKAEKTTTLAIDIFRQEGDTRNEIRALKALADTYDAKQDYTQALKEIKKAESLAADFGDKRLLSDVKHDIAAFLLAMEQPAEAAKVAMEALKMSRIDDDLRGTAKMLFVVLETNTRVLQIEAEETAGSRAYKQAVEKLVRFAREAVGISVKLKDRGLEAAANHWLAYCSLMQGNMKVMQEANKLAETLAQETGDKGLLVRTMILTANYHVSSQDPGKALKVLGDALTIATEAEDSLSEALVKSLQKEIQGSYASMQAASPAMMALPVAAAGGAADGAASAAAVEAYRGPDETMVKSYISSLVMNMTGSSDEIDSDTPLMESGIDSLASVELRTQLQQEFRINLPSTVMFNYPTIQGLTGLLVEECTNKKISWGR